MGTEVNIDNILVDLNNRLKDLKTGESVNIFMENDQRFIRIDCIWGQYAEAFLENKDAKRYYSSKKVKFEDATNLFKDVLVFLNEGIINKKMFKETND